MDTYNNMFLIKDGFKPETGRHVIATALLENGSVVSFICFVEHLLTGKSMVFRDLVSGTYYPDSQIVQWRYATDEEVESHGN